MRKFERKKRSEIVPRVIDVCGYGSNNSERPKILTGYQQPLTIALGCADPSSLQGLLWIRQDNNGTITCPGQSDQVYHVTCVDNMWVGPVPMETIEGICYAKHRQGNDAEALIHLPF
ncbi:hypothetical protein HELRODRAFT_168428 [Helobdella robusta]|uniref:Uncharacterized protein n=1 Tax=Helobdella robusta TaxID=6412 RepID=T1F0K8_HELRO|nr:hypothetical protein HELRODRAFT_168428 [Helobdella robusta]ESO09444.1 hypothetical protein HELRODRAFT_168428 [Helobdella robusta]